MASGYTMDNALDEVERLAIQGARDDPRGDKSGWIRVWVAARRHRGLPWESATWKEHYEGRKT